MGQRLVINIEKDNKRIANIYYHWSAYTLEALDTLQTLLHDFYDNDNYKNINDDILRLIRILEDNGGGVSLDDYEYVKNLYPNEEFKQDVNRNYGLISISDKSMKDTLYWAEHTIFINLDDKIIYNNVLYIYNNIDEFLEEYDGAYSLEDVNIVNSPINLEEFNFNKLSEVYCMLIGKKYTAKLVLSNNYKPDTHIHLFKYDNKFYSLIS